QLSKLVLRLELNTANITDKRLVLQDIAEKIENAMDKYLNCIHTDDNAEKLVMRVRIRNRDDENKEADQGETEDAELLRRIETMILNDVPLCGIPGIKKVFMNRRLMMNVDEKGEVDKNKKEWV